jgi:hypothetical protein
MSSSSCVPTFNERSLEVLPAADLRRPYGPVKLLIDAREKFR